MDQLKDLSQKEKISYLDNHADVVEEGDYFKPFTEDELTATKSEYTSGAIHLGKKEIEMKDSVDLMKGEIKSIKAAQKNILKSIVNNGEEITGKLFGFADQEKGTVSYYDENGSFIKSRRLRPEERQVTAFNVIRTAANS